MWIKRDWLWKFYRSDVSGSLIPMCFRISWKNTLPKIASPFNRCQAGNHIMANSYDNFEQQARGMRVFRFYLSNFISRVCATALSATGIEHKSLLNHHRSSPDSDGIVWFTCRVEQERSCGWFAWSTVRRRIRRTETEKLSREAGFRFLFDFFSFHSLTWVDQFSHACAKA